MLRFSLAIQLLAATLLLGVASARASESANPHGDLEVSCASCHTEAAWTELRDPLEFDHASTGFELLQGHEPLSCRACHESLVFSAVPQTCSDCHADPHSGDLGASCESCHTADGWDNRRRIFDLHSTTLFPLTGAHAATDCAACHRAAPPFEFSSTPTECFACHSAEYLGSTRPNHQRVGFATECQECHTTNSWQDSRFAGGPNFDHSIFFALEGAHRAASCSSCHQGEVFAGTPTDCLSCHRADYDATVAPPHAASGLATACETCHDPFGWEGATLDHDPFFVLAGAHTTLDCDSCHGDGIYAGTPRDCFSCHQADYQATTNPDHAAAGFETTCEDCHSEATWEGATFDHDRVFVLAGAHRGIDCESCHVDGLYTGTPRDCASCHLADYEATTEPNHAAAGFPTACETCHDESSWQGATFDHDEFFALVGAHRSADCSSCHLDGIYAGTPRDCASCHLADYEATTDPDHQASGFGTTCDACHGQSTWEGADFDHDSIFPLFGAHATADCAACHVGDVYAGTPRECVACHASDYESTTDPDHQEAGFPTACEDCHDTLDWRNATLDHDQFFPLTGSHRRVDCLACHADGYEGTPTDCFSCHANDYNATVDPNHSAAGFPTDCETCHDTTRWSNATFDHDAWDLTGAHAAASCQSCHADGFAGTPTDCFACHADDYEATDDPNHREAGFPVTCEDCHDTSSWAGADFDHDDLFALIGGHSGLSCESCHVDGFEGTPTDCYACHADDYEATTDPDHADAGFSTSCEDCHDVFAWANAAIDHDAFFPLTGSHRGLDCESCHADGFEGTPTDCYSCHVNDYNATENPNHSAAGFQTTCEDCHDTFEWTNAVFDHDAWELTGAHRQLDCQSCHADGFEGTPTDCFACHADDYDRTTDPDHRDAGFPTDCETCHNTRDWTDATFDHDEFYPLTGAHTGADCIACHADGFEDTPTDCYACHVNDYNSTEDPNHAAAGFSTDCEECHTTSNWDATFDHDPIYPLTGAHRQLNCESCHADGFEGTPTDCFSCHADDYDRTTNPDHRAAGFPTSCEDCHTTSDWRDAEFDHDALYFPIYSGKHEDEWRECTECHVVPDNFAVFECVQCHEHNRTDMDDEHDEVPGYVYESQACYACHPSGED